MEEKQRILVAEEDEDIKGLIQEYLPDIVSDCLLVIVSDGKSALEQVQEGRFDLLILGIKMPGDLVNKARKKAPNLKIILMNAEVPSGIEKLNINGFLSKPFSPAQLRARAQQVLGL